MKELYGMRKLAGRLGLTEIRTFTGETYGIGRVGLVEEQPLPAGQVIALYDAFEAVAEQLIGRASSLMVSWKDSDLTLATETDRVPDTAGLSAAVRLREEEGILYMDLSAQKGGDTA